MVLCKRECRFVVRVEPFQRLWEGGRVALVKFLNVQAPNYYSTSTNSASATTVPGNSEAIHS